MTCLYLENIQVIHVTKLMDRYRRSISQMESEMDANYHTMRRDYLSYVMNLVHSISLRYLTHVQHNEQLISYVSHIPAKYWHMLYECYDFLLSSEDVKLSFGRNQIRQMYIRLIPTWIDFNAVKRHKRFKWYHRFYYDKVWSRHD
jgi:hypothetical protein